MSQSLANVKLHIIFSTKNRAACLSDSSFCQELYSCIGETSISLTCPAIQIGGWLEHIHILLSFSRTRTISEVIKEIKRRSTIWIKQQRPGWRDFAWQNGYAAFSVSQANIPAVIAYIKNQQTHHGKISFQDEYRKFLRANEISFNEAYVWD